MIFDNKKRAYKMAGLKAKFSQPNFVFILLIFVFLFFGFTATASAWTGPTAPPPMNNLAGFINNSTDVQSGATFNLGNSLNPAIIGGDLRVFGQLCLDQPTVTGACIGSWSELLAQVSFWSRSGNNLYSNIGGNVGIGTGANSGQTVRFNVEDATNPNGNNAKIRVTNRYRNPEFQLQYGSNNDNDHWALYNEQSDDSLNLWSYNAGASGNRLTVKQNGSVSIAGLAGTGNRCVSVTSDGTFSAKTADCGTADNLGNHTATQNLKLNNFWLSNDGDNEGIRIGDGGRISMGAEKFLGGITNINGGSGSGSLFLSGSSDAYQYSDIMLFDNGADYASSYSWGLYHRSDINHNFEIIRKDNANNYLTALSITPIGAVGIGSRYPAHALEIGNGNILVHGSQGFDATGEAAYAYLGDTNNFVRAVVGKGVQIGAYQVPDAVTVENSTGRVGVNSQNPVAKLEVRDTTGTGSISLSSGVTAVSSHTIGDLNFYTYDSDITNNVVARVRAQAEGAYTAGDVGNTSLTFSTKGTGIPTEKMRIRSNGSVNINDTSNTAYKFYVNGSARVSSLNINGVYSLPTTAGTSGQVLMSNGGTAPYWGTVATGPTYTSGTGITISSNTISAQNTTALWNANQLQGRTINTTAPSSGQVLKWNGSAWAPAVDIDTNTTYSAGTGISISNNNIAISWASAGCSAGSSIRSITSAGVVTCETDDNTTYSASTGLALSGTTFSLTGQALALHNLGTSGLIARTGAGTVAGRTITAGNGVSVANGNGVSGNPTIGVSLNYERKSATCMDVWSCSVSCSSGYKVVGGGCDLNRNDNRLHESYPGSDTSWFCRSVEKEQTSPGMTVWAICLKIN